MSAPLVEVHDSADELATAVAGELLSRLADAQEAGRVPHILLTGGTIADAVHCEVARLSATSSVDWARVEVWWGDERFVEPTSSDRNDLAARQAFLDQVGVDETRVHPMASTAQEATAEQAAASYAAELGAVLNGPEPGFDIAMFGMGPDGHVASLFPDFAQLDVDDVTVVAVHDSPKPPPDRLSLTYPALNAASSVWFLVSGEAKAEAAARALGGATTVHETPVSGVQGRTETVWFLDRDAAAQI